MHGLATPSSTASLGGKRRPAGPRLPSGARGNEYSVGAYFAAFVTVVLIAVLVAVGWLEYRAAASERAQLERSAAQKARDITAEIDLNMVTRENLLTVLAGSYSLLNSDIETFYRQAADVGRQLDVMIALRDPATNSRIFNTEFPWGTQLEGGSAILKDDREQALRSGKPAVSDVFLGTHVKRYIVAVTVPVTRDGALLYFLTMAFDADKFVSIFDRLQVRENQVAMIVDRRGAVVARSQRQSEFVGQEFHADFLERESQPEGVAQAANLEGVPFEYFFNRSAPTGWRVMVGVPGSLLLEPRERALRSVAITFGLLLLLGGAIAYAIGRRISRAIGALRSAAIALGQHEPVAPPMTALRETNEVASAIWAASTELRKSDEQLRLAVDAAELGTWTWNIVTGEFFSSERAKRIFGIPTTMECTRSTFLERIHPSDCDIPEEILQPDLILERQYAIEYRILDPADQSIRWVSSKGRVEFDETGKPLRVHGVLRDISSRKKSRHERDDLRLRLMRAQEQERLRLAHELHDQTGQSLTAIMMELKAVEADIAQSGRDRLRRLRKQLDQMGRNLHRVAWELRPASINELGLTAALSNYASEWSAQSGIEVDFHCGDSGLDGHSEEVRTTLYRVVQEALTNIARHAAGATTASITINRANSILRLTIEDDGNGFDSMSGNKHSGKAFSGLGLAGMRERLSLIGGELEIESSVGVGTTIFVRIEPQRQGAMT
jgi:two-component system sensor histidine kinase UhpB